MWPPAGMIPVPVDPHSAALRLRSVALREGADHALDLLCLRVPVAAGLRASSGRRPASENDPDVHCREGDRAGRPLIPPIVPLEGWQVARSGGSSHRVLPAQAREPREVGVRRVQFSLMLDAQRCQVGIGREVTAGAEPLEEPEQDLRVALAGVQDGDVRARQPRAHAGTRRGRRKGVRENLAMRGHATDDVRMSSRLRRPAERAAFTEWVSRSTFTAGRLRGAIS